MADLDSKRERTASSFSTTARSFACSPREPLSPARSNTSVELPLLGLAEARSSSPAPSAASSDASIELPAIGAAVEDTPSSPRSSRETKTPTLGGWGKARAVVEQLKKEKKPGLSKISGGTHCRDSYGKLHDIKALRDARHAAVMKGMKYMHRFLLKNHCAALYEVGDDAATLFFEIWYTSANTAIRAQAKGIARDILQRYEKYVIPLALEAAGRLDLLKDHPAFTSRDFMRQTKKTQGPTHGRDLFFDLMFCARAKTEMGDDAEAFLVAADELWKANNFRDTDELFGMTADELYDVDPDGWVCLTMRIMIMQFNEMLFPGRYRIRWGVFEACRALRKLQLSPPPYDPENKFHDSFYCATHILFMLSAYSAIKMEERQVPWLFKFVRRSMMYWSQLAQTRLSGRVPNIYVDIDGLAEAVDCFRCCGLTDANDAQVCTASVQLLALQRKDGSWPTLLYEGPSMLCEVKKTESPYTMLHPTWVATQSLRDRNFELARPGNQKWSEKIVKIIRAAEFTSVLYKIKYQPLPARSSKKRSGQKRGSSKDSRQSRDKPSGGGAGRRPLTATSRRA